MNVPQPQATGPEVMVSYSSQDRAVVMQIVQRLRAAGVAVWIDFGGIDGAQRWGEEIVNAIEACKTVLLVVSPNSMQSENIAKEVALAWEGGKRFLPVVLEDAKIPKSMQYQLAGIQHIKLHEGDPEQKFVAVLRALVRLGVAASPYYIALVSAEVGEKEQAFEWLNQACELRSGSLARLKSEERFRSLHSDPRFAALVERVESLTLQPEDTPVRLQMPTAQPKIPTGPQPLWKKLLWPDIYNDVTARQAAALGVWACVLIAASSVFALLFSSLIGSIQAPGFVWTSPLVLAIIFAPIAFGTQKMGRPAAAIGAVLCGFGLIGNFNLLNFASMSVDTYSKIPEQYRAQYPYPNPYPTYLYAWFSILVGVVCVMAFINALRGTFSYHDMVTTGRAKDKQDAITPEDWAATKAAVSAIFRKTVASSQGLIGGALKSVPVVPSQPQSPSPSQLSTPVVAPTAPIQQASIVVAPVQPVEVVRPHPVVRVPLSRGLFAQMIGAGTRTVDFWHAGVFLLANVLAGVTPYALGSFPPHAGYWLLAASSACVFSIVTVLAFRFIGNSWLATVFAALFSALLTLPFYNLLWTFNANDIFYREQFQQFILLPFIHSLVFLLALVFLVPRLQQLLLAYGVSALVAEICTPLATGLFHAMGAGDPPDPVLAQMSVPALIVKSLVFGLAMWGGLEYLKKRSAKAYSG